MTCTATPGLHNDGCSCPPDPAPLSAPPYCRVESCEGGAVTVQKTSHREYDHRGMLHDITFHTAIGSCAHALRHRVVRIDHTGRRTVLSEAITEYATA